MRSRYVIAGIGHTAFGSLPGRDTVSMNVEAIRRALEDAGVDKARVDGLFVKFPTSQFSFMYGHKIAEATGLHPKICTVQDQAGASNISNIAYATMAIEAGQCDIAVATFADNPKSGTRGAMKRAIGHDDVFGMFGAPSGYAMIARRHMGQWGTTEDDLGRIAVAFRGYGARNPDAQLQKPITLEDYHGSPPIVAPLRRDDCCLVSDGGAAVVVMSEKRAQELGVEAPIPILGFGQGHTAWDVELRPDLTTTAAKVSAETAFRMAGMTPKDIDVAQLYDCFTIVPLMTLEDYGFCKKGEGGRFVETEGITADGRLPTNTSGGLISETGMPGMQLVIEGVRQMRGTASVQVAGAQKCIVSNQGGTMHTHATLILGR